MTRTLAVVALVITSLACAVAQSADLQNQKFELVSSLASLDKTNYQAPATSGQTDTQTTSSPQTTSPPATKTPDEPLWEWANGVAIGVGYQSTTGSPGISGFNLGAGWRWKDQIELTTDMDFGSTTVTLGGVNSKIKRQDYLFGGRYYIGRAIRKHSRFEPFGHLMYGISHESVKTTQGIPVTQEISTAQTSWAWDFGGGVDYILARHWAVRGRADWLKTHFTDTGQSHFKWVAGFWYSFSGRSVH